MISLIVIIVIIVISILINYIISAELTWIVYYKGIIIGMLISGVVLKMWNYKKLKAELKKQQEDIPKSHIV